jgi:hypothetical protein
MKIFSIRYVCCYNNRTSIPLYVPKFLDILLFALNAIGFGLSNNIVGNVLCVAQERTVRAAESQNVPFHSTVSRHSILCNKWNGVIELSLDVSTLSIVDRVGPGWGPAWA